MLTLYARVGLSPFDGLFFAAVYALQGLRGKSPKVYEVYAVFVQK